MPTEVVDSAADGVLTTHRAEDKLPSSQSLAARATCASENGIAAGEDLRDLGPLSGDHDHSGPRRAGDCPLNRRVPVRLAQSISQPVLCQVVGGRFGEADRILQKRVAALPMSPSIPPRPVGGRIFAKDRLDYAASEM